MWRFQDALDWSSSPRYRAKSSKTRWWPFRVYVEEIGFLDLVTLIALHFSGWNAMSHFFSHAARLLRTFWRRAQSFWSLMHLYKMKSSAKSWMMDWTRSGRSLMKTRNSNGTKTVPYGTPLRTRMLSDVASSTVTCWVRSVRKALIQLRVLPLTP